VLLRNFKLLSGVSYSVVLYVISVIGNYLKVGVPLFLSPACVALVAFFDPWTGRHCLLSGVIFDRFADGYLVFRYIYYNTKRRSRHGTGHSVNDHSSTGRYESVPERSSGCSYIEPSPLIMDVCIYKPAKRNRNREKHVQRKQRRSNRTPNIKAEKTISRLSSPKSPATKNSRSLA
jgi:hypothetical protein